MHKEPEPRPGGGARPKGTWNAPPGGMRRVTVNAMTRAGWAAGSLHVPQHVRLVDFLNRAPDFLSLTEVFMDRHKSEIPYLALQRQSILFLVVDPSEYNPAGEEAAIVEDHTVTCIFDVGRLKGRAPIKAAARLSDTLAKHKAFLPLHDCIFELRLPWSAEVIKERQPFVLLNCSQVVGLSERPPGE